MATQAKDSNTTKKDNSSSTKAKAGKNENKTQKLRTDINEAGNWPFPIYNKE